MTDQLVNVLPDVDVGGIFIIKNLIVPLKPSSPQGSHHNIELNDAFSIL